MNYLYYNIIIFVLVLVLFLAYILIAYFYTSYSNYKEDVDDNFEKTKNYINTSISKIDDNIRSSITENNTKINNTSNYINDINKKVSRVDLKSEDNYYEVKNSLKNYSSNLNKTNLLIDSNTININKFDTNIKQFIQYKSNGTTINEAIYNYQFGVSPNLSLDLLRNVNAISGMTIETDNISNFRLCDKNKNCMDMNINNKGLNIFPTNSTNNTTDNILIYDKNKEKVLAKFDLKNRGIYLGGEDENAGMYIQDSNVYVKKLNIINNSDKYASIKTLYDKNNKGQIQSYNTYPFELDDINNKTEINGIYSIIKGTETPPQNEIIINFKCSNDIPSGTTLSFNIQELSNTSTTDIIITSIETIPTSIISSATLNTNIIKIITSTIIYKHRNYRIKIKNVEFNINSIYTEPNITNIINHRL
jgi:hypothetical protein